MKLGRILRDWDKNAFELKNDMLRGVKGNFMDIDLIQFNTALDQYVIIELLGCEKKQFQNVVTPYTSHPNRYFSKDSKKFIQLWKLTRKLDALLFLVNFINKKTNHDKCYY